MNLKTGILKIVNVKNIITQIKTAISPDEIRAANQAMSAFLGSEPNQADADAVRLAFHEATATILDTIEQEQQATMRFIALNGTRYNLDDWLTPAEYARQYKLSTPNVVTNWIARGIIPQGDILEVKELNGIRLIRNHAYKTGYPQAAN